MCGRFEIVAVDKLILEKIFPPSFPNFEDVITNTSTISAKTDFIITQDKSDFKQCSFCPRNL